MIARSNRFNVTAVSVFVGIVILPVLTMFWHSVVSDGHLTFEHYTFLFLDQRQLTLLFRSILIAGLSMTMSLVWGVPYAFLIARTQVYGHKIFRWAYLLPLGIPPHIHTIAWMYTIKSNPALSQVLQSNILIGLFLSAMILSFSYYPFVVLLTLSGLNDMDHGMEEAALLFQRPWQVLKKVTLPLTSPYMWSGAIFVFVLSLFDYGVPSLLQVQTYPIEIFAQFSAFYNEGRAMAQSFPLIVTAVVLFVIQRYVMGGRSYVTINSSQRPTDTTHIKKFKVTGSVFLILILVLSVAIPVCSLIVQAQNIQSFTVALKSSYQALLSTLLLSAFAATLITMLGYFMAQLIVSSKKWASKPADYLSFIPFAIPATALGIGMIYFWNRPIIEIVYQSVLIVIIAYMARFVAFAIRAMVAELSKISPSLYEAADLFEKNYLIRLIKIDLPLAKMSIAAAWIVAFVLCMNELGATLLVIPPGLGTISLKIYNLMHYGADKLVAALSIILISINLFMSGLIVFFIFKRKSVG